MKAVARHDVVKRAHVEVLQPNRTWRDESRLLGRTKYKSDAWIIINQRRREDLDLAANTKEEIQLSILT